MPDPSALLGSVVIALLIAVMLAFTLGTQRNIRKGNARLEWLQPALPELGGRTTLRWLGSSVVQLALVEPREPFREVSIMFVLEPRDVPLLWMFARASGRRDVLIFRTSLRRAPTIELEAHVPAAWLKADDLEEAAEWPAAAFPDGVRATASAGADAAVVAVARRAWEQLAAASDDVWRVSVRRTVPHLEVHVRPPTDPGASAARLVAAIRELAVELSRS